MEAHKPTISYDDISLRALEPEDLDLLYQVENDVSLWSVGVTNKPYSRYALHEYIASASGDIYVDHQVRLIICNRDGETVGMVDLMNFNPQHRRAEVGIVILDRYRNQGFGLAAMAHMCRYAHATLHLHQLYALVGENNPYSIRLFEGAGFEKEGVLRDWIFDGDHYHDVIIYQRLLSVE